MKLGLRWPKWRKRGSGAIATCSWVLALPGSIISAIRGWSDLLDWLMSWIWTAPMPAHAQIPSRWRIEDGEAAQYEHYSLPSEVQSEPDSVFEIEEKMVPLSREFVYEPPWALDQVSEHLLWAIPLTLTVAWVACYWRRWLG